MVICLERGADLHMAQRIPLPLTVYCFSKIQIRFTFLVPAHPGSPRQTAVKRVCVCVCVCVCLTSVRLLIHVRSANCVMLFRRTPPASSPSSIRHRRLLPFLVVSLVHSRLDRLRQLCPGRASSILTAAPPVCSQRCGSSGVSPKSLRS